MVKEEKVFKKIKPESIIHYYYNKQVLELSKDKKKIAIKEVATNNVPGSNEINIKIYKAGKTWKEITSKYYLTDLQPIRIPDVW